MINILIVEDDQNFAEKCAKALLKENYNVFYCGDQEEAKAMLIKAPVDLVIIDLMLPPTYTREGLDLFNHITTRHPRIIPFLMTTKDSGMTELVSEAMSNGARYFFDKKSSLFEKKLLFKIKEALMTDTSNIFISHGHNELLKLKLKDFISTRLDKKPIILSEQPSKGMTVVEKLEMVSERCRFAIILMTKDDEQKEGGLRARQNVIHEIGFFQGKYGRKNVILLAETGVELFSNISGIIRIEFDQPTFETVFEPIRIEIEEAFAS